MKKQRLQILNIDGTQGCGKTTQLNLITAPYRALELPIKYNLVKPTKESIMVAAKETAVFLQENPEGIVLNDGSLANPMIQELIKGTPLSLIEDDFRDLLYNFQVLSHSYAMANIIIIPENMEMCDKRIKLGQKLSLLEETGIEDVFLQQEIMKGFNIFDHSSLSRNLKFQTLTVYENENMMEINKNLIKMVSVDFDIKKGS